MRHQVSELVTEHIAAFNAHDSARLLRGFADDAVWATGQDVFRGSEALAEVFDPWLWTLNPSLELRTLVADETSAAAELMEELTHEGEQRRFPIAVFFRCANGLITHGTVYREGTADLD